MRSVTKRTHTHTIRSNSTRSMNFWALLRTVFCCCCSEVCVRACVLVIDYWRLTILETWRWVTASDNIVNDFLHELMWTWCTFDRCRKYIYKFITYHHLLLLLVLIENMAVFAQQSEWSARNDLKMCNCSMFNHCAIFADHRMMTTKTNRQLS